MGMFFFFWGGVFGTDHAPGFMYRPYPRGILPHHHHRARDKQIETERERKQNRERQREREREHS